MIRFEEILELLYRFRFLTREQIQKLLGHKYHSRIRKWLNELEIKEYIEKDYDKSLVTKPAIYSLGKKARKYLKENGSEEIEIVDKLLDRVWRNKDLSREFKERCVFVADFYLKCKERDSEVGFYNKTDLYGADGFVEPLPEALILMKNGEGERKHYLLEVFEEMPPRMFLRKRVKDYINYYEEGVWEEEGEGGELGVIMIFLREKELNYTQRYMEKVLRESWDCEGLVFWLSLRKNIRQNGLESAFYKVEGEK